MSSRIHVNFEPFLAFTLLLSQKNRTVLAINSNHFHHCIIFTKKQIFINTSSVSDVLHYNIYQNETLQELNFSSKIILIELWSPFTKLGQAIHSHIFHKMLYLFRRRWCRANTCDPFKTDKRQNMCSCLTRCCITFTIINIYIFTVHTVV